MTTNRYEAVAPAPQPDLAAAEDAMAVAHAAFGQWLMEQVHGGDAALAFALIARQRRGLGRSLAHALFSRQWHVAQVILQPLYQYWLTAGLSTEAKNWHARALAALMVNEGFASPGTDAGNLWFFVMNAEALSAFEAGDLQKARAEYEKLCQMLEASGKFSSHLFLAGVCHQLGLIAESNDLDEAEHWHHRALEIREKHSHKPDIAASCHHLGRIAKERDALEAAEQWFQRALKEAGHVPQIAATLHELGSIAQRRGDLVTAEQRTREALAISLKLGDLTRIADAYGQLAHIAMTNGKLDEAEHWFSRSLAIDESLNNVPGLSATYGNIAMLAAERGDLSAALDWLVRANSLFPDFPSPVIGKCPQQLALITAVVGWPALEEAWQRLTGKPLPDDVRTHLPPLIEQAKAELEAEGQAETVTA